MVLNSIVVLHLTTFRHRQLRSLSTLHNSMTERPELSDITLHLNGIEQLYL